MLDCVWCTCFSLFLFDALVLVCWCSVHLSTLAYFCSPWMFVCAHSQTFTTRGPGLMKPITQICHSCCNHFVCLILEPSKTRFDATGISSLQQACQAILSELQHEQQTQTQLQRSVVVRFYNKSTEYAFYQFFSFWAKITCFYLVCRVHTHEFWNKCAQEKV